MATSTIIQKLYGLDEAAAAPSVGQDNPTQSARCSIQRFRASGVVAVGETVRFDVGATDSQRVMVVNQCTAGGVSGNRLAVGVALEAAPGAGAFINVITGGYAEDAICVAGAAAGDVLGVVTAAGSLEGTCDVWVLNRFN